MKIVSIEGVNKLFGRKRVLENVSFEIGRGEILGIVGASGAGKSVLLKILIGFISPSSGTVLFNSGLKTGFSMQNNSIYDYLTVKQNLIYFSKLLGVSKKERKEKISFLLNYLHLEDFKNVLVKKLSGGTKKRVDIACSLLNDPDLIILDEPFVGLDAHLISLLLKYIIDLNRKGKTIIISSHRINELLSVCSRTILVKDKSVKSLTKSDLINILK